MTVAFPDLKVIDYHSSIRYPLHIANLKVANQGWIYQWDFDMELGKISRSQI